MGCLGVAILLTSFVGGRVRTTIARTTIPRTTISIDPGSQIVGVDKWDFWTRSADFTTWGRFDPRRIPSGGAYITGVAYERQWRVLNFGLLFAIQSCSFSSLLCTKAATTGDTYRNQNAKGGHIIGSFVVIERYRILLFVIVRWLALPKDIMTLLFCHIGFDSL
jgi:hypothetical protein